MFSRWHLFCSLSSLLILIFLLNEEVNFHKKRLLFKANETSFRNRLEGPVEGDDPKLALYLLENILQLPSSLPYNLTGLTKSKEPYFDLQNHMFSKFSRKTFSDQPSGFFLETRAFDGETLSNSLWLEIERNWTGLLIEPSHTNCLSLKYKHRKAWTACSCVTPKRHAETTVLEILHEYLHSKSEFKGLYRANVRSVNSRAHTVDDAINTTLLFTYQKVQCFPLIAYLKALNITVIDLLSLDTLGGEKDIVLSLPLDKIKIRYMFIENYKAGLHPKRMDTSFVDQMEMRNYILEQFNNATGQYIFVLKE